MNRYRLSILFLLAIILFANQICAQTTPTYKISGNVIATATGKPFFYGMVLVNKKIYSCDSSGNFSIPDLPGGTYKLSFTAEYSTKDTLVTLTDKDVFIQLNVDWNCLFYNKTKALRDIEKGVAVLITKSSFTPIVYTTDKNFKRKYNVDYSIEGCVAPDRNECVQAYNEIVFEYLDKKYGRKWRKEVRKDIIGL